MDVSTYIPTPSLFVDGQIARRNIHRMADYARQHRLNLRPHSKTHKSCFVAQLQLAAGAMGMTVAKVGEAEVMAAVCDDILVAYPTVDPHRSERAARLARQVTLRVGLDSMLAAERLSQAAVQAGSTVGVLVDVDLGFKRTGVQSDQDALDLGQAVDRLPGLRLDGIMTYTGHILGNDSEQSQAFANVAARMDALLDRWRRAGLSAEIVSSGSTPAALHCHLAKSFTEIRPGTYVYNDMNTVRGGYCTLDDCAARIHATVISANVPAQVVIDAGSKTLTSDLCGPAPQSGYGYVVEYPDAKITRLSEEHGQVDVSACAAQPELGERLTIIPNHICVCVNMQSAIWWREPEGATRELRVDGRGLLV
jgi:D-serine deaminase-like pyridoxal phosphate-dependent protein